MTIFSRRGLGLLFSNFVGSVASLRRNHFGSLWLRTAGHALLLILGVAPLCVPAEAQAPLATFEGWRTPLGGGDFSYPTGVALDSSGNVYVTSARNHVVKKMPVTCLDESCVTTLGGGFIRPVAIAVDKSENVFITDDNAVKEIPAGCTDESCVTTLGGGFGLLVSVALDSSNNVYVADTDNRAVKKIPVGCTDESCVTTLIDGFFYPRFLVWDSNDNLYVNDVDADFDHATGELIKKIAPGCTHQDCVTKMGYRLSGSVLGFAADRHGNVYFAGNLDDSFVTEIPAGCTDKSCMKSIPIQGYTPDLAVDERGDFYAFMVMFGFNPALQKIVVRDIDFGLTPVGLASAAATAGELWFHFPDQKVTLGAFTGLTFGTLGQDFAVQPGGSNPCKIGATYWNHGAGLDYWCSLKVSFTPTVAGPRNGAVELRDNAGRVVATVLVHGAGTAPQVAFNSGLKTAVGGGFSNPNGVTVDGEGNAYVADTYNNAVKKVPVGCGDASCAMSIGGGFNTPNGVALDGEGNVYVSDGGNNAIKEIPVGCSSAGCVTTLIRGMLQPNGIVVDGAGNIYVAETGNNAVREIPAGCIEPGCVKELGGGFNQPNGVSVDGAGNVYVADTLNDAVKKMASSCTEASCVTPLGGRFNNPLGVSVDGGGNVYVADAGSNAIQEMAAGCVDPSCVKKLEGGFNSPGGVSIDGRGNVYVADSLNDAVQKIDRMTPPEIRFTSTAVGGTSSGEMVKVANIGNLPLRVTEAPSTSAPFAMEATPNSCSPGAPPVAVGGECTLGVKFQPTQAGPASGSLVLTDNNLNATAAPGNTQTIGLSGTATRAATMTAVTSSENPSRVGDRVIFTATVTNSNGNNAAPTGTVQFMVDGSNYGSPVPLITGGNGVSTAELQRDDLAEGNHTIRANYQNSDGNFNRSVGNLDGGQTVEPLRAR